MRKILYSPGYGAGWTSWYDGSKEQIKFMLECQPFIKALEANKIKEYDGYERVELKSDPEGWY